jgi:hypothetical protein
MKNKIQSLETDIQRDRGVRKNLLTVAVELLRPAARSILP